MSFVRGQEKRALPGCSKLAAPLQAGNPEHNDVKEGKEVEDDGDLQVEILEGLLEAIEGALRQGDVVVRKLERVQPGRPS